MGSRRTREKPEAHQEPSQRSRQEMIVAQTKHVAVEGMSG